MDLQPVLSVIFVHFPQGASPIYFLKINGCACLGGGANPPAITSVMCAGGNASTTMLEVRVSLLIRIWPSRCFKDPVLQEGLLSQ